MGLLEVVAEPFIQPWEQVSVGVEREPD
jgi:hypothetical protein